MGCNSCFDYITDTEELLLDCGMKYILIAMEVVV